MNRNVDQYGTWIHLLGQIVDPRASIYRQREPTPSDVLLGRGRRNQKHVGNIEFLREIDQHLDLYHQQKKRGNKQEIVMTIVEWVRGRNGSFLKQTFEGNWIEVDESTAKEKVSQAFRHRKLRLQDSSKVGTANRINVKKQVDAGATVDAASMADPKVASINSDDRSAPPKIAGKKLSSERVLTSHELSAGYAAEEHHPKRPSLEAAAEQKLTRTNSSHSFSLLAAHAIKPYPVDINLQPFSAVGKKLPPENPSQPEHSSFPNKTPSHDEDDESVWSTSLLLSPSRPECQSVRVSSDHDVLVSDAEILDAIKTLEAQGPSRMG